MTASDSELLQQFARDRSEDAFGTLVKRHVDLVYSAALRQVCSSQLAEDVSQSVFLDLSRNADKLKPDTILTAWLYRVTRRTAIDVVRTESRRQLREQIAVELADMNSPDTQWNTIAPLLDKAMETLDEEERSSILLRYFENKSLREVGKTLGTSDDAAQKRVSRAVERLREYFSKNGVAVGSSGFVALLSANAVQSAPMGLAVAVTTAAALAGTSIAAVITTQTTMNWINIKSIAAILSSAFSAGTGIYLIQQIEIRHLRDENQGLIIKQEQLVKDRDIISSDTTASSEELERVQKERRELIRLRGEVGILRRKTNELAALADTVVKRERSIAISQTNTAAPPSELFTRTFKVGTNGFALNLKASVPTLDGETSSQTLNRYLKENGINIEPPGTIYWNYTQGLLMMRTTLTNLENTEALLVKLGAGN